MPILKSAAFGWENCARLSNDSVELLVTLDVGPRILSYRALDGQNVLGPQAGQLGTQGEEGFRVRGGHRLWTAPEEARSYEPDNSPVEYAFEGDYGLRVAKPATAPWRLRKSMTLTLDPQGSRVRIEHQLTNEGSEPTRVAAWALSVMAPGGVEYIPQPPLGLHGKGPPGREFLPDRVIVPWSFTDFTDARWRFGRKYFTLEPKSDGSPTKLGLLHTQRWVGYLLPGAFFVKTLVAEPGATYPDLGCNFETFTEKDFIELESLSPLRDLAPGESVGHTEHWYLFNGITPPASRDEAVLDAWFAPYLAEIGIPLIAPIL